MDEDKEGRDWPPALTKICYSLISYIKVLCSSQPKFLQFLEITVQKIYKNLFQIQNF